MKVNVGETGFVHVDWTERHQNGGPMVDFYDNRGDPLCSTTAKNLLNRWISIGSLWNILFWWVMC